MPNLCQTEKLRRALARGPMTSLEILNQLGIARAAARVHDLRHAGVDVIAETVEVTNRDGETCRVARYSLAAPKQQPLDLMAAA